MVALAGALTAKLNKKLGYCIRAWKYARIFAERANTRRNGLRIEAILVAQLHRPKFTAKDHAVAERKRLRQSFLKNLPPHGIRARLENRPETPSGPTRPRGV